MSSITLTDLTKQYPRQPAPAIHALSLDVQQGELVALLGPSGSGKSTVLKLIAGIEQPDRGDILLDGRSILRVPANQRGAVLMFQKAYLFPFLSVADNIGFGLKMRGEPRATIRREVGRLLELIGLPGTERRFPAQLSGGEQQRVALARALITEPKVLMLDEPLSSLDSAVRHTLQEAIRRIQRELGITTLLVTHDLMEAVAMSDRTALLLDGHIVAHDRPARLFERPATEAAARFMGISTFLRGRLANGQLDTPHGALHVMGGNGHGRAATFAIRPEHTRVLTEPCTNSLRGVVQETIYKGEWSEVRVALDGSTVRARLYHPHDALECGAPVWVHLPREHLFEVNRELQIAD